MPVLVDVNINTHRIGNMDIARLQYLDLSNPDAIADVVSNYVVTVDRKVIGVVKHRYGDRVWKLVALAAQLVADKEK